jgi:hypothetical protein
MEQAKNYINSTSYKLLEAKRLKANSYKRQSKADNISTEQKAQMLIEVLHAKQDYLRWYCRVVNTLTESVIQNILEGARQADAPANYFAKAAKYEMQKVVDKP